MQRKATLSGRAPALNFGSPPAHSTAVWCRSCSNWCDHQHRMLQILHKMHLSALMLTWTHQTPILYLWLGHPGGGFQPAVLLLQGGYPSAAVVKKQADEWLCSDSAESSSVKSFDGALASVLWLAELSWWVFERGSIVFYFRKHLQLKLAHLFVTAMGLAASSHWTAQLRKHPPF